MRRLRDACSVAALGAHPRQREHVENVDATRAVDVVARRRGPSNTSGRTRIGGEQQRGGRRERHAPSAGARARAGRAAK